MAAEALQDDVPNEPQPGMLVAGKYRVRRVIGRGGMGRVLAATNEATGKHVALKWVLDQSSPDAAARFVREARAAGRIHHANVVDVYDVVEHEGATVIVMEELRGETLAARIAREKQLPLRDALDLAIQIARGVAAAHGAGVIHRDLKPSNVFLCDEEGGPRVKILDFGISKVVEPERAELTDTGVVLGTPQYLAPEQVRSAADVDERADVYAMGAVLYEMLTGRPPHQHAHVPALLVEIATVAPRPVGLARPEVGSALSELVSRTLAKDPDARFPTADALIAALRQERGRVDGTSPRVDPVLDADTIDPARAHATPSRGSVETAETLAAGLPAPPPADGSHEARSGRAPVWIALGTLVVLALGAAWWSRSGAATPPRPTPSREARAAPEPSVTPLAARVVEDPAPAPIEPPSSTTARPEAPAPTRARTSERREAAPRPTDVPAAAPEAPPPSMIEGAPAPLAPTPRAGRLGLDDL